MFDSFVFFTLETKVRKTKRHSQAPSRKRQKEKEIGRELTLGCRPRASASCARHTLCSGDTATLR